MSVEFEPVKLGPSRRRVDPVAIAALVVAIGLVAAFLKPWDAVAPPGTTGSDGKTSAPAGSAVAAGRSPASSPRDFPARTPFATFLSNEAVLAATTSRSAWGVRAVVVPGDGEAAGATPALAERWLGIDVAAGAAWTLGGGGSVAGPHDDVLALGVTTPDDALPLDVRFWRLDQDLLPQRVIPIAIPGPEPASWLWFPDPTSTTVLGTWPAGTYRIDVLLGPRIVRLVVAIPQSAADRPLGGRSVVSSDLESALTAFEPGGFAIVASRPTAIGGADELLTDEPLADEREAWLGSAGGGLTLTTVAQVSSPDVSGLGVLFAAGEQPAGADVVLVPPAPRAPDMTAEIMSVAPGGGAPGRRAIVVRPGGRGVFQPGLYRLTVSWRTSQGIDRRATWQVEIVPSTPATPPTSPLGRMRRWVGLFDRPDNPAEQPLVFLDAAAPVAGDGCAGSTRITPEDQLIGIVVPDGTDVSRVRLLAKGPVGEPDVPIRVARNAIPRLTIVAVHGGALAPRDYDLLVDVTTSGGVSSLGDRICVR